MMKMKLMIAITAFSLGIVSCGESTEAIGDKEAQMETAKELGNKLDELNLEIKEIEAANADIDATINELNQI